MDTDGGEKKEKFKILQIRTVDEQETELYQQIRKKEKDLKSKKKYYEILLDKPVIDNPH